MTDSQIGQFGVVRTNGLMGHLIRWATKSDFNHAFLIVSEGTIAEAEPTGARLAWLAEYGADNDVRISSITLTPQQRGRIVAYGWAAALAQTRYGFLDILAFALATRGIRPAWVWHKLDSSKTLICSQLVATAFAEADIELCPGKDLCLVSPGDLADVIEGIHVPERW